MAEKEPCGRWKTTYVLHSWAQGGEWKLNRFAFSVEQEPERGRWSEVQSTSYTMIGGFVTLLRAQIQRLRRVIPVALWRSWSHYWSQGKIDWSTPPRWCKWRPVGQGMHGLTGVLPRFWNYHTYDIDIFTICLLLLRNSVDHMIMDQNRHASPFHYYRLWYRTMSL